MNRRLDRLAGLSQNSHLGSNTGEGRLLAARSLPSPRTHYRNRGRLRRTASGRSYPYNLRFAGQYHQAETGLNQNWNRDYDPLTGKYIESDPIGLAGGVNTYSYVRNRAVSLTDPRGLDYWIEGPNPDEPAGHQSVCVGDPLGTYRCFSFGVNGNCCLQAAVYEDDKPGGPILPSAYRKTNGAEDYAILNILAKQLSTKGQYSPWNTCRNFSIQQFLALARAGFGTPTVPPNRPVPQGSPSVSPPFPSSTITDSQGSK